MQTYRVKLGQVRSAVAEVTNLCSSDSSGKLIEIINAACSRLLIGDLRTGSGKWPGVCMKLAVSVSASSVLTQPREIETVEVWWLDNCPHDIRNQWYEALQLGVGLLDNDKGRNGWQLIDDGETPGFSDVVGTGKTLAIKPDITEADDAAVALRFYGTSAPVEKVRSENPPGTFIEGEKLLIPAAGNYQLCSHQCGAGGLYQVIKPKTRGVLRLYEFDGVSVYRQIGAYEPSEEVPTYRRYRIPGLSQIGGSHTVTVIGKVRFVPAYDDEDMIQIPMVEAVRLAAQAIHLEKSYQPDEAAKFWQMAFFALHSQLAHFRGAGTNAPIKMKNSATWGAGGVGCMR